MSQLMLAVMIGITVILSLVVYKKRLYIVHFLGMGDVDWDAVRENKVKEAELDWLPADDTATGADDVTKPKKHQQIFPEGVGDVSGPPLELATPGPTSIASPPPMPPHVQTGLPGEVHTAPVRLDKLGASLKESLFKGQLTPHNAQNSGTIDENTPQKPAAGPHMTKHWVDTPSGPSSDLATTVVGDAGEGEEEEKEEEEDMIADTMLDIAASPVQGLRAASPTLPTNPLAPPAVAELQLKQHMKIAPAPETPEPKALSPAPASPAPTSPVPMSPTPRSPASAVSETDIVEAAMEMISPPVKPPVAGLTAASLLSAATMPATPATMPATPAAGSPLSAPAPAAQAVEPVLAAGIAAANASAVAAVAAAAAELASLRVMGKRERRRSYMQQKQKQKEQELKDLEETL
jgi:hypothetical protein